MIKIKIEVDEKCEGKVACHVETSHSLDIANALAHLEAVKVRLIESYIQMTNTFIQKTEKK